LAPLGSCPSGCEIGEDGTCCACALADGSAIEPVVIFVVALADGSATEAAGIFVALADGSAIEPVVIFVVALAYCSATERSAIFVPGKNGLSAGALPAVSRLDGLGACNACESALNTGAVSHAFAKMENNTTSAASVITNGIQLISAFAASFRRRGSGSRVGSGDEANSDVVRES
jgi:hypothetical protein